MLALDFQTLDDADILLQSLKQEKKKAALELEFSKTEIAEMCKDCIEDPMRSSSSIDERKEYRKKHPAIVRSMAGSYLGGKASVAGAGLPSERLGRVAMPMTKRGELGGEASKIAVKESISSGARARAFVTRSIIIVQESLQRNLSEQDRTLLGKSLEGVKILQAEYESSSSLDDSAVNAAVDAAYDATVKMNTLKITILKKMDSSKKRKAG